MTKWRVLFFLVSLVAWTTRVDTPVFAQTQTTNKKAQDMAGIESSTSRTSPLLCPRSYCPDGFVDR